MMNETETLAALARTIAGFRVKQEQLKDRVAEIECGNICNCATCGRSVIEDFFNRINFPTHVLEPRQTVELRDNGWRVTISYRTPAGIPIGVTRVADRLDTAINEVMDELKR